MGDAILDQWDRGFRRSLRVEAPRERADEAWRVREIDRGRRHRLAEPPDERATSLGVSEPVEGRAGEQVAEPPHGVRLEHDRILAWIEPGGLSGEQGLPDGSAGQR